MCVRVNRFLLRAPLTGVLQSKMIGVLQSDCYYVSLLRAVHGRHVPVNKFGNRLQGCWGRGRCVPTAHVER
jgi:hypothetical protein